MRRLTYDGLTFEPYIDNEKILSRIKEMAGEIARDYADSNPLFLCVLNGAVLFASELFVKLGIDAEITFIRLKSYEGTSSTGHVKQVLGLQENLEGRHVVIVEDIVDTGHTIVQLLEQLKAQNPASVKIATLLYKPEANVENFEPDYVGFNIPQKFIIGYGLDIDGKARNLPDIWSKVD